MNLFTKTLAAGAAALTLALAFAPAAEARGRHGGHGFHGGHRPIGIGAHHLRPRHHFGHRFHGHRRWAGVGVIGVGYGGCIRHRTVYNPYIGAYVTRRVNVCI
jgi:hypothetical protein